MPRKKYRVRWKEVDPLGRTIKLTREAYSHVKRRHSAASVLYETARATIKNPLSIWRDLDSNSKVWYYFNKIDAEKCKLLKLPTEYLMVVVKKFNGDFFVVSWYNMVRIDKKGA